MMINKEKHYLLTFLDLSYLLT